MKRKLVALVTLVTFTLSGCGGFQTRVANADLNMGTNALNKRDYALAEKKLKEAVNEGHLDRIGVGWNNLGVVYEDTGRWDEAVNAYWMGARYGELLSAVALNRLHHTIPSPDLVAKVPPVSIGYKPGQTYFQDGLAAAKVPSLVEAEKQYRLAIITGQELASSWNNLGAAYSRFPIKKELARFCYEVAAHYGSVVAQKNLVAMGKPFPPHDLMTREQKDAKAARDKEYADARKAEEQRQAAADAKQFASNAGEVLLILLGAAAIGAGEYYAAKGGASPSLTSIDWPEPAARPNVCNCKGFAGPGGPCYAGPGGAAYDGPGGPANRDPGGACYAGPGGPAYDGPGGPAYRGPGGPRYDGPGGAAYDGPGGAAYSGPGGRCYAGAGGPCYSGPAGRGANCPAVCK